MANTISPQGQLEKTYNAAADYYDHPALSFWDRFGRRTVERLPLAPGMEVLDVYCGMGGSALRRRNESGQAVMWSLLILRKISWTKEPGARWNAV
jgi:ubiquinone/menaquinone biosynthesis C-methylase UbiE